MELRSGKALVKGDRKEESENDPEEDIGSLMEEGYAVSGNDKEELILPTRIENVEPLSPSLQSRSPVSAIRRRR